MLIHFHTCAKKNMDMRSCVFDQSMSRCIHKDGPAVGMRVVYLEWQLIMGSRHLRTLIHYSQLTLLLQIKKNTGLLRAKREIVCYMFTEEKACFFRVYYKNTDPCSITY